MKPKNKRRILIGLGAYAALWALTGISGERQIDARFDDEFAEGIATLGQSRYGKTQRVAEFDVSRSEGSPSHPYPEIPWKYQSRAVAVAPFVLVDKCAYQRPPR